MYLLAVPFNVVSKRGLGVGAHRALLPLTHGQMLHAFFELVVEGSTLASNELQFGNL